MSTIKEATIETIRKMSDCCTVDDIIYEINFVAQVLEGLKDSEEGKTISAKEFLSRVEKWSK